VALKHERTPSNDLRAPAVPRGMALIVTRYRRDVAKVALVNPEDLAMLEESHDILEGLGELAPASLSKISRKALRLEDRPDADARVEDAERIAEILNL
jgi:predicted transcriptional regulator